LVYHVVDQKITDIKDPFTGTTYVEGVLNSLTRLHYADYGGYALKIVSFLLALVTCFVIISGILIWLEARNKKAIPESKRRFNERVGHLYLAMCLSMYPVTALAFIVTKLIPEDMSAQRQTILYEVYFGTWLLMTVLFTLRKSNTLTNRVSLMLGAVLGIIIPILTGLTTNTWFWTSLIHGQHDLLIVDVLWLSLSAMAIYALYKMSPSKSRG
jgi:ACR3 family arsenite efflux pump ArsB